MVAVTQVTCNPLWQNGPAEDTLIGEESTSNDLPTTSRPRTEYPPATYRCAAAGT